MKLLQEMNVESKKVILRCDLNVTIKDGKILSDEKIRASLETINYLLNKHAKVIIMSHLGRVETKEDKKDNSLRVVYERLSELLKGIKVSFCPVTHGQELESLINEMQCGDVLLMENTRFEDIDGKKESKNNLELAKYWAGLGDIFINDAFGVTHRQHASNSGITKYIENGIGFLIQKELEGLKLLINPVHPFVVIMGGAKVDDKIELIANVLKKCDYLLVGGGIANTFLAVNHDVGKSLVSEDYIGEVKKLMAEYPEKIIVPVDAVVETGEIKKVNMINDQDIIYDIGPATIEEYRKYLELAETTFINGTAGMYEDKRFAKGTKALLDICDKAPGVDIIGGGDAVSSVEHFGLTKKFHFISTGGGATLDYIGSGKLRCLED